MSENWLAKEIEAENQKLMKPRTKALIGGAVFLIVASGGIAVAQHSPRTQETASTTPITTNSTSSTPSATPTPTAASAPTSNAANLNQIAQEDNQMAQADKNLANQDVQSVQGQQQALNNEAANCTQNSQALSEENQAQAGVTQTANQLAALSEQQYSASSGLTLAQWLANYKAQETQLEDQENSYQQQFNTAKSEVGGC